jgi:hypothetical protein
MGRGQFPIKSPFAQEQTLKRVGIYLPSLFFPRDQLYVAFLQTSWFDNVAVAIAEGYRQRIGSYIDITRHCISRSALKFQIYR